MNWLIEVAEHFPLTRLSDSELSMSRNRRGNALENFFTGMHGENWHLVHHLQPAVPFWNLAPVHEILLADPEYAAIDAKSSGLFVRGPQGAPSIVSTLNRDPKRARA